MASILGKTIVVPTVDGAPLQIEELPHELARQYTDAEQAFRALLDARAAAHQVCRSMRWKSAKTGTEYLARVSLDGSEKGLGPRTTETEATYERFMARRDQARQRVDALTARLEMVRRMNRAMRIGRAALESTAADSSRQAARTSQPPDKPPLWLGAIT